MRYFTLFFYRIKFPKFNVYLTITALLSLDWSHFNSLMCLVAPVLDSEALEF